MSNNITSSVLRHLYVCLQCDNSFWEIPPGFDTCQKCRLPRKRKNLSISIISHSKNLDLKDNETQTPVGLVSKNTQAIAKIKNLIFHSIEDDEHVQDKGEINVNEQEQLVDKLAIQESQIDAVDDLDIFDDEVADHSTDNFTSCIICNLPLSNLSVERKELHINICLDNLENGIGANHLQSKSPPPGPSDIISHSESTNTIGAFVDRSNNSLDSVDISGVASVKSEESHSTRAADATTVSSAWGVRSEDFFCVVCGFDLSRRSLPQRCLHLKRCARLHGVGTRQLLQMLAPQTTDGDWWKDIAAAAAVDEENDLEMKVGGEQLGEYVEEDATDAFGAMSGGFDTTPGTGVGSSNNALSVLMNAARRLSASASGAAKTEPTKGKGREVSLGGGGGEGRYSSASNRSYAPSTPSLPPQPPAVAPVTGKKRWRARIDTEGKENDTGNKTRVPPPYKLVAGSGLRQPVVVDGFQFASPTVSRCYFLTHFHSDHYTGLHRRFSAGQIFCSPPTAALVRLRLGLQGNSAVFPLAMNMRHAIDLPGGGGSFTVELIDANHCPGAVCLLFTFSDGKQVLHTGDFRWSRSLLGSCKIWRRLFVYTNLIIAGWRNQARECAAAADGDDDVGLYRGDSFAASTGSTSPLTVYLDTTYCDEQYNFPPQEIALDAVVRCVREELGKPGNPLFVFGAYGIGKERVYMSVAEALDMRVFVDRNRWRGMLCFDWPQERLARLTTDPSQASIWVAPLGQINFRSLAAMKDKKPGSSRVVGFQPTGWTFGGKDANDRPNKRNVKGAGRGGGEGGVNEISTSEPSILSSRTSGAVTVHSIPYSEHSSFGELVDFLRVFRPGNIIPTVGANYSFKSNQQVELLQKHI